ncbi:hypothetical protein P43SY_002890 [Pythium insidiosum]|uniref:PX domain-containing protein n=1 Tax=Pythium insidiosum TaxID=114742 RepID=A0AAD5LTV1_PYTIN|nr:hypothetical protein P43SY_002890 [Pythium insidiosum]
MVIAAVQRKIRELQAVEVQLTKQNSSLRDELRKFEAVLDSLQQHLADLRVDEHEPEPAVFDEPDRSQDFAWVNRVIPLLPQLHDDYDVYSLMQRSFQEVIVAARVAETYLARAHQVLGWRDTRLVNDTWVEFVFSKEIMHSDMETIAAKTWALQSDGVDLNGVMPQKHNMRVLRRINDNTLICARNLLFPGDKTNYCTVYLLLRVEYGDGYVVAQRTLEPEDPAALDSVLGSSFSYVRVFYGLMMSPRTRVDDDGTVVKEEKGCHVKFGGRVGNGTVDYATSWAMDILVAILRWENKCVGPVLQLVDGDDTEEEVEEDQHPPEFAVTDNTMSSEGEEYSFMVECLMANMLPVSSTNPPVLVGRRMSTGTRKRSLTRTGSATDGAAAEAAGVLRKSDTEKELLAFMPIGVAYMERVSLDISVTKDASDKGGAVRYVMTVQQLGSTESWQHARTYDEYRSFQQRLLKAINLGHFCSAGCPWLFTFVKSYFPKKHLFNFTSTRVVTARRDALQRFFSTLQSFVLDRSNHCCAVVSHAIANELVCFIYGNHLDGASLDVFARDSGPAALLFTV